MKIRDLFFMAFRNLWRRKLRTALTVLGVVIGCTSIIVMVSFGFAQQKQLEDLTGSASSLQTINVYSSSMYGPPGGGNSSKDDLITDETIGEIEKLPNVESVSYFSNLDPNRRGSTLEVGEYIFSGPIGSATEEYIQELNITEGRLFNPDANNIEVIVSNMASYMLMPKDNDFDNYNPTTINVMDEKATLILGNAMSGFPGGEFMEEGGLQGSRKYRVDIVGTFEGDMMGTAPMVLMASEKIDLLNEELNNMAGESSNQKEKTYESLIVSVEDTQLIEDTTQAITDMGYDAYHNTDFIETMNQGTLIMQAILGGIGGIALIVAAIGITNSMVMSVYERTKEIGVMKVIGAKVSDIRNLFLLEAGLMGFIGGVVGVIISLLTSKGLNSLANTLMGTEDQLVSIVTPGLAIAAMVICFLIGLITGYYPAVKATKMSALEAIRTE